MTRLLPMCKNTQRLTWHSHIHMHSYFPPLSLCLSLTHTPPLTCTTCFWQSTRSRTNLPAFVSRPGPSSIFPGPRFLQSLPPRFPLSLVTGPWLSACVYLGLGAAQRTLVEMKGGSMGLTPPSRVPPAPPPALRAPFWFLPVVEKRAVVGQALGSTRPGSSHSSRRSGELLYCRYVSGVVQCHSPRWMWTWCPDRIHTSCKLPLLLTPHSCWQPLLPSESASCPCCSKNFLKPKEAPRYHRLPSQESTFMLLLINGCLRRKCFSNLCFYV